MRQPFSFRLRSRSKNRGEVWCHSFLEWAHPMSRNCFPSLTFLILPTPQCLVHRQRQDSLSTHPFRQSSIIIISGKEGELQINLSSKQHSTFKRRHIRRLESLRHFLPISIKPIDWFNACNFLLNIVCVADRRFVPLHADALSAEVLECLIPRTVPIGQHTVWEFARKGHTNLDVLVPHHVPRMSLGMAAFSRRPRWTDHH